MANFQGIRNKMNKADCDATLDGLEIEEEYSRFLLLYYNLWKGIVQVKGNSQSKNRLRI